MAKLNKILQLPGTKSTQGRLGYVATLVSYVSLLMILKNMDSLDQKNIIRITLLYLFQAIFLGYHLSCLANGKCTWYSYVSLVVPVAMAVFMVLAARDMNSALNVADQVGNKINRVTNTVGGAVEKGIGGLDSGIDVVSDGVQKIPLPKM